jgi:hypothetical protein
MRRHGADEISFGIIGVVTVYGAADQNQDQDRDRMPHADSLLLPTGRDNARLHYTARSGAPAAIEGRPRRRPNGARQRVARTVRDRRTVRVVFPGEVEEPHVEEPERDTASLLAMFRPLDASTDEA